MPAGKRFIRQRKWNETMRTGKREETKHGVGVQTTSGGNERYGIRKQGCSSR